MGRRLRKDEGLKVNMVLADASSLELASRALTNTLREKSEDSLWTFNHGERVLFSFHVFKTRAGNWSVMEVINE